VEIGQEEVKTTGLEANPEAAKAVVERQKVHNEVTHMDTTGTLQSISATTT
jgi:hypothetical protein